MYFMGAVKYELIKIVQKLRAGRSKLPVRRQFPYKLPPNTFFPVGPGLPPAGSIVTPKEGYRSSDWFAATCSVP